MHGDHRLAVVEHRVVPDGPSDVLLEADRVLLRVLDVRPVGTDGLVVAPKRRVRFLEGAVTWRLPRANVLLREEDLGAERRLLSLERAPLSHRRRKRPRDILQVLHILRSAEVLLAFILVLRIRDHSLEQFCLRPRQEVRHLLLLVSGRRAIVQVNEL